MRRRSLRDLHSFEKPANNGPGPPGHSTGLDMAPERRRLAGGASEAIAATLLSVVRNPEKRRFAAALGHHQVLFHKPALACFRTIAAAFLTALQSEGEAAVTMM